MVTESFTWEKEIKVFEQGIKMLPIPVIYGFGFIARIPKEFGTNRFVHEFSELNIVNRSLIMAVDFY